MNINRIDNHYEHPNKNSKKYKKDKEKQKEKKKKSWEEFPVGKSSNLFDVKI